MQELSDISQINIKDVQNVDTKKWCTIICLKINKEGIDNTIKEEGLDRVHELIIEQFSKELKGKL